VLCAAYSGFQSPKRTTIVITGDIAGYLSPCGCTTPMTGGIARQATLVHRLERSSDVVLLANGALSGALNAQEELKIMALSEMFGALRAAAINLSHDDARFGIGTLQTIQNLTDQKLICGSIEPLTAPAMRTSAQQGGLLIGGVASHPDGLARSLGSHPVAMEEAVHRLVNDATEGSLVPVLLLDGSESDASAIAVQFPALKLVIYRSYSDSPQKPIKVGRTLLVTPGPYGKSVVTLSFDGENFAEYQVVRLGPEYADDPQVGRFIGEYLRKVDKAGFIDRVARRPSAAFAGSRTCGLCHEKDFAIWKHSKHAVGLKSLEDQGHARDPDCVSCHVVGLDFVGGFRSRAKTPDLAAVGCESCHGPGAHHSQNPQTHVMPKVGMRKCLPCHAPDRSPKFNSLTYWTQILHR
jgi:hypothetical protein